MLNSLSRPADWLEQVCEGGSRYLPSSPDGCVIVAHAAFSQWCPYTFGEASLSLGIRLVRWKPIDHVGGCFGKFGTAMNGQVPDDLLVDPKVLVHEQVP